MESDFLSVDLDDEILYGDYTGGQMSLEHFVELLQGASQLPASSSADANQSQNRRTQTNGNAGNGIPRPNRQEVAEVVDDGGTSNWATVDTMSLLNRKETSSIIETLRGQGRKLHKATEYLDVIQPPAIIPEYEEETPTQEEQIEYIQALISNQRLSLTKFCSRFPFSIALSKRLAILENVMNCISRMYHKEKSKTNAKENKDNSARTVEKRSEVTISSIGTGSEVLVELGVKTGLTLLFSLLRQAWLQGQMGMISICNDVFSTASSILISLPPLTLGNEAKLSKLAIESIDQVLAFLATIMQSDSIADSLGRQLGAEMLLGLSLQKGSLVNLLNWIEIGLKSCTQYKEGSLNTANFINWLRHTEKQKVKCKYYKYLYLYTD